MKYIVLVLVILSLLMIVQLSNAPQHCKNKWGQSYIYYQDNAGGMFCKSVDGTLKPY